MIIHNATIHSPVERFATALHIENGVIVWMGEEDTAQYRATSFPDAELHDCGRALITPAFHNTWVTATAGLHAQGITAAHVDAGALNGGGLAHLDLTGRYTQAPATAPGVHVLASGADAHSITEFLARDRPAGVAAGIQISTTADLKALGASKPSSPFDLLYIDASLGVDPATLLGWNLVVVFDSREVALPLAGLASAGIPYALGGDIDPWTIISRALHEGPAQISARAAFNALTRGAWRLTPGVFEPAGVLRVGAAADLALWQVDTLAVQAPDVESSFWSTDERAGTPLLPALGEEEPAPRLQALYHHGALVDLSS